MYLNHFNCVFQRKADVILTRDLAGKGANIVAVVGVELGLVLASGVLVLDAVIAILRLVADDLGVGVVRVPPDGR